MNKNIVLKVIVVSLVITSIVGVWFIKNKPASNQYEIKTPVDVKETDKSKGNLIELPSYELEQTDFNLLELKSYGVPIMLDFGAAWCPPCQEMKPDVVDLYNEYKDEMFIIYLDVDKLENGTYGIPIQAVPTQYFFDSEGNPYVTTNPIEKNIEYLSNSNEEHIYTRHQGLMTRSAMLDVLSEMGVGLND